MPADEVRRRFTILDAMLLVAAMALGIAVDRAVLDAPYHPLLPDGGQPTVRNALRVVVLPFVVLVPCFLFAMAALRGRLLLGPRPGRRRLRGQPGWLAIGAGCLVLAVDGPMLAAILWASGKDPPVELLQVSIYLMPLLLGTGVGASWLTARPRGRWPAPADWIDRAGRWLGWFWIAAAPSCLWYLAD